MFTGIIEELGTITAIEQQQDAIRLTVQGPLATSDVNRGDSIAVGGTCLTAVEIDKVAGTFTADVMHETIRLTSLQGVKVGDRVNLERAMTAATRFGGHVVQGHVDGVGTVSATKPDGNALVVSVEAPSALMRYMVPKGSIALDGVSLTLAEVREDGFDVWLIPETCERTRIGSAEVGMRVNLEVDILAKYVEKLNSPN